MSKCMIFGASNIDIFGKSNKKLKAYDSNIGKIEVTAGGVARNVAESLSKLGVEIEFITSIGGDINGDIVKHNLTNLGISHKFSKEFETSQSSSMFIANEVGEMQVAISHMEIYDQLEVSHIKDNFEEFNKGDLIVLDTNFSEEVVCHVLENAKVPVFVDTISNAKATKIKNHLEKITYIKPNHLEIEVLTGIKVNNFETGKEACEKLLDKGVKNVFLTIGENGAIAMNKDECHFEQIYRTTVENASGAGDSFVAGAVYGILENMPLGEILTVASACASLCVEVKEVSRKDFSKKILFERIDKIKERR